MTQPRPTAVELLDAVATLLRDDVLPRLEGSVRFQTRVAVTALETVARELGADAVSAADLERRELATLLGIDDAADATVLERELARRIRAGEVADDDPNLDSFLRRTVDAALDVANPRYAAP